MMKVKMNSRNITLLLAFISLSISFQNCGSVEKAKVEVARNQSHTFEHNLPEYDSNPDLWYDAEPREHYLDIALLTREPAVDPRQNFIVVGSVGSANFGKHRVEYELSMTNQYGQTVCPRQRGVLELGATSFRVHCESNVRARALQVKLSAIVNGETMRLEKIF